MSRARVAADRFPLAEVNALAAWENHNKHLYRPAHYVHKWWARRPGSVFRALLLALLLPDGEDVWQRYYAGANLGGAVVLDPFMGGGTTLAEALRLGCRAIGCDLNPVAYWTARMAITRVDVDELDRGFAVVAERAAPEIRRHYTTRCLRCGAIAEAHHVLWVHELPCCECGEPVPLHPGWVVARRPTGVDLLCPRCEHLFRADGDGPVACPRCQTRFDPGAPGLARGRRYRCPECGSEAPIARSLAALAAPCPVRPFAVLPACPHHEPQWQPVTPADRAAALPAGEPCRCPTEPIPPGAKTGDLLRHGCRYWRDLFLPRQLLCLDRLLGAIQTLPAGPVRDLLLTGFSTALEFNNRYCTYKGGHPRRPGAVRHLFSHHAFVFPRWPLENHVWGAAASPASGSFAALYRRRIRRAQLWAAAPTERRPTATGTPRVIAIPGERLEARFAATPAELLAGNGNATLLCADAATLALPPASVDVVVTDPPYYDYVMYGELADFFHVWLRLDLALAREPPDPAFLPPLVPKEGEVVANRARAGADRYARLLERVFARCRAALKPEGALAFTFHHRRPEAWAALVDALANAGFLPEAALPVGAESRQSVHVREAGAGTLDLVILCRPRGEPVVATWETVSAEARRRLAALIARWEGATGRPIPRAADRSALAAGALLLALGPHWPAIAGPAAPADAVAAFRWAMRLACEVTPASAPGRPPAG